MQRASFTEEALSNLQFMMKDQVVSRLRCQKGKDHLKFYRTPTKQRASITEEALSFFAYF
jgi:hypothetical protein